MRTLKFLKKKRSIWIIAAAVSMILLAGYFGFGRNKGGDSIQTGRVLKQNLQQTVLTTGQVVSSTDLSLSFQASGTVRMVLVKEGDRVLQGQLLASLNSASAAASLTTAQGSLAQAEANYDKLMAGSSPEDLKTYETAVIAAKQDLESAYSAAINTLNDAYLKIYNSYTTANNIQTSYFSASDQEGIRVGDAKSQINTDMSGSKNYLDKAKLGSGADVDAAILQNINYLNEISASLKIIRDACDEGVYNTKVSAADKSSLDTQRANINTALTGVTNFQQTIAADKIAIQKAQDQFAFKKAPARQAEIDEAKAQILSAQGQVQSAKATLSNLVIVSPMPGTITSVDVKVGEQATAAKEVIVLQDVEDLHAEADVSEANVALLAVGQSIDYTFDALGPDEHFAGKILTINPASTIVSGVVNYKIKASFDAATEKIKPGMTANMTILVAKKDNVLAVPSAAIINKNNKNYVRVIEDAKKKTYREVEAQTGLQADGGLVEIVSGLQEGQEIVTYIKK